MIKTDNKKGSILEVLFLLFFTFFCSCSAFAESDDMPQFFVPSPPFSEDIYPCSMCHEGMETNTTPRQLEWPHDWIKLKHSERQRWCLDCHDAENRDQLRLANGDHVSFKESYKLCGQCHGTIFRDWKVGVHGKRTGEWNGKKQYRLCVHCHYPHNPKYKDLKPLPPPAKPDEITGVKTELIMIKDNVPMWAEWAEKNKIEGFKTKDTESGGQKLSVPVISEKKEKREKGNEH